MRKVRWAAAGRGKRGGVRIIYYWAVQKETILLLYLYSKNTQTNLSARQLRDLRRILEGENL